MRLASFLFTRYVSVLVIALLLTPFARSAPPTTGASAPAPRPRQVRFEVQITRAQSKSDAVPNLDTPTIVGSPIVTTLDRNTASVAVTGGTTSYNLALSPTIENTDNAVQILWNLRLNGKDFPGGTSSFTMTGATRVIAGTDTPLAEMTLSDPKTGQAATFRVRVRVAVDDTATPPASSATP